MADQKVGVVARLWRGLMGPPDPKERLAVNRGIHQIFWGQAAAVGSFLGLIVGLATRYPTGWLFEVETSSQLARSVSAVPVLVGGAIGWFVGRRRLPPSVRLDDEAG